MYHFAAVVLIYICFFSLIVPSSPVKSETKLFDKTDEELLKLDLEKRLDKEDPKTEEAASPKRGGGGRGRSGRNRSWRSRRTRISGGGYYNPNGGLNHKGSLLMGCVALVVFAVLTGV